MLPVCRAALLPHSMRAEIAMIRAAVGRCLRPLFRPGGRRHIGKLSGALFSVARGVVAARLLPRDPNAD